jgi:hypothetical protein
MFHPKLAALRTIKCPPGWPAALPIEIAETQTRIRRRLLMWLVKVIMHLIVARFVLVSWVAMS